jgi:hypothetical protein
MTDKSALAHQLIALFLDHTATVSDLTKLLAGKEPRTDLTASIQDQVIGFVPKGI